VEGGVEVTRDEVVTVGCGADGELVENALILVQITEFRLQGLENLDGSDWLVGHGNIPHLNGQEVS
jgi:hypothetical protein